MTINEAIENLEQTLTLTQLQLFQGGEVEIIIPENPTLQTVANICSSSIVRTLYRLGRHPIMERKPKRIILKVRL